MSDEEWDQVIRVHLRGHFLLSPQRRVRTGAGCPSRPRARSTAGSSTPRPRRSSPGSPGQPNYSAAKAGHHRAHAVRGTRARPPGRDRERDLPARPHRDDRGRLRRRGRVRRRGRPAVARSTSRRWWPTSPRRRRSGSTARSSSCTAGWSPCSPRPVVEQRFDASGATWDLADLDKQVGLLLRGPRPGGLLRRRLGHASSSSGPRPSTARSPAWLVWPARSRSSPAARRDRAPPHPRSSSRRAPGRHRRHRRRARASSSPRSWASPRTTSTSTSPTRRAGRPPSTRRWRRSARSTCWSTTPAILMFADLDEDAGRGLRPAVQGQRASAASSA